MLKSTPFAGVLAAELSRLISPDRADLVAESTGIHDRTIRSLRSGESGAWFENVLMPVLADLGPAAWNAIAAHCGMGGMRYLHKQGPAAHVLLTKMTRAGAVLAEALEDGRIDHQERPRVDAAVADLADAATHYSGKRAA